VEPWLSRSDIGFLEKTKCTMEKEIKKERELEGEIE
jgi:hypothetical protein